MKKKLLFLLVFGLLLVAALFSFGAGSSFTGLVASEPTQFEPVHQTFTSIFLFLALAVFVVGLLHKD